MGLGELREAAIRERRRRLLGDDMVPAAVRRPSRAQLGALVDGELPIRLSATPTSQGLETGPSTDALHSSPKIAGNFTMDPAPCKLGNLDESLIHHSCGVHHPVEGKGLLCLNGHAATTTSEQVVGLQQVKQLSGRRLCPGPAENEDASFLLQVEGPLCSKLTGAALVDGECQTYDHAVTPETLMTGFNTSALHSSSAVAGTRKDMVEQTLMEHEDANASHSLLQVEQTHRHAAATARSEKACELETLIPEQHPTMIFQSLAAAGKFSMVDSQDSDDSDGNDSILIPIFVRHDSGELTFSVRMHESTNDLMQSYSKRTKTTLDSQYFVYDRKRLEPQHTWLSCGIKRDTTVHVCTRLLGGADHPNLQEYIDKNKEEFITVVPLPDGGDSLQMTIQGCRFLSSWIRCFTAAFSAQRSWDGGFELVDFIFDGGHVRPKKKPWKYTNKPGAVGADIIKFADNVERILLFSDKQNVVSNRPPYVQACMHILRGLVTPPGVSAALTSVQGIFPKKYKLLLDTLVCCMTSYARERLIIELYRKYEGADANEKSLWDDAIKDTTCPSTWRIDLRMNAIFNHFINRRNNAGNPYPNSKAGAFNLLRDVVMHATDYNENLNASQAGDGIELTIPATLENFLPSIIKNLIEKNIDISSELSAAISCACDICDASH